MDIIRMDSVDSTNLEAKRRILLGKKGAALYIANMQTSGKGRLGRSFYSPHGQGIYMTLAYPTQSQLSDVVSITAAAAVAVMRSVIKCTGKMPLIKWVNDLYLDNKKVCGILAESVQDPDKPEIRYVILGIGINLKKGEFPTELAEIAGSLESDCDPDTLILDITDNLLYFAAYPQDRSYMQEYREHSMVLGREVICQRGNESFSGIAEYITDSGALVVRDGAGTVHTLESGEVTLRIS